MDLIIYFLFIYLLSLSKIEINESANNSMFNQILLICIYYIISSYRIFRRITLSILVDDLTDGAPLKLPQIFCALNFS